MQSTVATRTHRDDIEPMFLGIAPVVIYLRLFATSSARAAFRTRHPSHINLKSHCAPSLQLFWRLLFFVVTTLLNLARLVWIAPFVLSNPLLKERAISLISLSVVCLMAGFAPGVVSVGIASSNVVIVNGLLNMALGTNFGLHKIASCRIGSARLSRTCDADRRQGITISGFALTYQLHTS